MPSAIEFGARMSQNVESARRAILEGRSLRLQGRLDLAAARFREALALCPAAEEPYWHNTALNEIEITEGAEVLRSRPRSLSLVLSNRCNIECIMCSVWNDPWEMPEKSLRDIAGLFPTLCRLMWQGGEVFMSPRFEPLFDMAAAHPNLQQHITTNGLLLGRRWARKIAWSNTHVIFSIDGVTKATYERIRKEGRFERLLEGLRLINEARDEFFASGAWRDFPLTMNATIMRSNVMEMEDFVDFAHEHRFKALQINPVDISGPEDIFRSRDAAALAHISEAVPRMRARAEKLGLILHVWLPSSRSPQFIREPVPEIVSPPPENDPSSPPPLSGSSAVLENRARPNVMACHWPWQDLWIDKGGRVRPHCFCGNDIGNVTEESVSSLWNNERMRTYRRRLYANAAAGWCANRCVEGAVPSAALSLED